jgi:cytochrome P450
MLSKYTKFSVDPHGDTLSHLLRSKLSQNLAKLIPQLKEELEFVVATEFPECKDWTPVKFQPFALRTVARLSGRAFVGPTINRQEEWMDTSINFAVHVFIAALKLQFFPDWMRPFAKHLVSELRQINRDIETTIKLLKPMIEERVRDLDMPTYDKPPEDMIQWFLETLPEEQRTDYYTQTLMQLVLAAASIHTTNNLLTDCMYDLASYPDVQEMLREEVYQIMEVEKGWERKDSMAKLKKLDSFIKESQRLSGNISKLPNTQ